MTICTLEPWATVAQWCASLPHVQWYNCFGFVMISVYDDANRFRYSVSPCGIDEVPSLSRDEFLARLAWKRHCQEMPVPDEIERHILLPGISLLGKHIHGYWATAQTVDDAFSSLLADPVAQALTVGDWFIAYKRVPAPNQLRWAMRKWKVMLYTGPNPFNHPPYHEYTGK